MSNCASRSPHHNHPCTHHTNSTDYYGTTRTTHAAPCNTGPAEHRWKLKEITT